MKLGMTDSRIVLLAIALAGGVTNALGATENTKFDGRYTGTMNLTGKSTSGTAGRPGEIHCNTDYKQSMTVKNGQFEFPFSPSAKMTGTVTDDGRISGQVQSGKGMVFVSARLAANSVSGEATGAFCTYKFELKKN